MMTINTVSMNNTNLNVTSSATAISSRESKTLQTQLTGKQQILNRLSSNEELTASEKEKERRKIQREIAELNRKLQQERMAEKEEAKEAAKEQSKKKIIKEELFDKRDSLDKKSEDKTGILPSDNKEKESVNSDIPVVTIKNVLAATSSVNLETVQENVSQQAENRQNILATEIRSDEFYNIDTTSKKEELSDMRRQHPLQIETIGQHPESVTSSMDFGSKIIIRE